ncbi:MAG: tetratricopeptide repeat protein [Peptococcaceae bacterium]|nr:tetratricopeptide repeat protein [Peptococcaceae bacterium]
MKPSLKIAFIIGFVVLCTLAVKLTVTFIYNEAFIAKYRAGDHDPKNMQGLFVLNWPESYVAHYNYGNTMYWKENYDAAIDAYDRALSYNPPFDKECAIRINIALCLLKRIKPDDETQDILSRIQNIEKTLDILNTAKEELFKHEDGCAHREDNNGHNETAEQLKADIEKMENELQRLLDRLDKEKDSANDVEDDSQMEAWNEELKELQKEAADERKEGFDSLNENYHQGKTW